MLTHKFLDFNIRFLHKIIIFLSSVVMIIKNTKPGLFQKRGHGGQKCPFIDKNCSYSNRRSLTRLIFSMRIGLVYMNSLVIV